MTEYYPHIFFNKSCFSLRSLILLPNIFYSGVKVNGQDLECVKQTVIFRFQISSDLTWNNHISEVVKKVNKRLYFLRQLKRAQVKSEELLLLYLTCVRPVSS